MVAFGQVTKQQYKLIETGEYVFTLNDVGEISGDYGDRMQWDFLVAEKETPTEYMARDDGRERVLRFFTDTDIVIDSRQHQWIQALAGRAFGDGDELPDGGDILGKRMVAYLTHYTPKKGKNAGVAKEDIVAGSAKPFQLPGRKATNGTTKAAAASPPAESADDRAALIAEIKKQIKRAAILDIGAAESWAEVDLTTLDMSELQDSLDAIKDAIESDQAA
jgi:hypothetical protein